MSGPIPIQNGGTAAITASAARTALGIVLNSNRSYSTQSISFGTGRTPSATNDIFVVCSVQALVTAIQTSTITVQIDSGSGFVTIATLSSSGVAITKADIVSFVVPANSAYKLVSAGTGSNSIVSTYELTL